MSVGAGNWIVGVAVGAVCVVLMMGLANIMRGGSANRSQALMRWRIGLQFLAIVIIMLVVWGRSRP